MIENHTTIRTITHTTDFVDCKRIFITDISNSVGYRMYVEREHLVPRKANRLLLHEKYGDVIEWFGDVSVKHGESYHCFTISDVHDDKPSSAALMIRLGCIDMPDTVGKPTRYITHDRLCAAVFAEAQAKFFEGCLAGRQQNDDFNIHGLMSPRGTFHAYRGTDKLVIWQICWAFDLMMRGEFGQIMIDRRRYDAFMNDSSNWRVIPPLQNDLDGLKIQDIAAVHSPRFNACVPIPPTDLSFIVIDDDDNELYRMQIREQKLVEYIKSVARRLNPRLPPQLKIKDVDDILA